MSTTSLLRTASAVGLAAVLVFAAAPASAQADKSAGSAAPRFQQRWFYAAFNLQVDKYADQLLALIERASKAGYNGMVLADYKLNRW